MVKAPPPTGLRSFEPSSAPGPDEVPCIEVLTGSSAGRIIPLRLPVLTIGRDPSSHVALDDDGVSRSHIKVLLYDNGHPNVVDLESTNGTFINGTQVDVAPLGEGDRIQLGPLVVLRLIYWSEERVAELERVPKAPEPEPLPLSPREMEIAELVVDGLTNPAIAEQLGISLRTVTTHLANVYRRLDVHSRAALTRVILEQRLGSPVR